MKLIFAFASLFLISTTALAGEPKATICYDKAKLAAAAIFQVNHSESGQIEITGVLVEMDHSEGGFEIWDFSMSKNGVGYSPYRITAIIDDCVITKYLMVGAG